MMLDLVSVTQAILVLDQGSFRKAAETLNVRPSVVSRRVRTLEDAIGVSLFQRRSQGALPTIAGKQFMARGRVILADVEFLLQTAASTGRGEEGGLRIGIVASIASGFARKLLLTFGSAHPQLKIEVIEGSPREHVAAVRALNLDLTFVTGTPLSPGCVIDSLWQERVLVALPQAHPLASVAVVNWDDLQGERFIVSRVDPGPEIQDFIIRGLADLGRHPIVEQFSVQRETLLALVGLGQGLSLVGAAESGVTYPGVVFRPLDQEEIMFSIVWSEQNDNPAFRRFLIAARKLAGDRRSAALVH